MIESNRWYKPKRPDELEENDTSDKKQNYKRRKVMDGEAKDDEEKRAIQELLDGM